MGHAGLGRARSLGFTGTWLQAELPPLRWNAVIDASNAAALALDLVEPGKRVVLQLAERMREFTGPTLVAWATEDRVMPPEHGRRLAEMIPNARHHEITDSYTMLPQDQPAELGRLIGEFLDSTAA